MKKLLFLIFLSIMIIPLASAYIFTDTWTENTTDWSITTGTITLNSTDSKVGSYSVEFEVPISNETITLNTSNWNTSGKDTFAFWMKNIAKSGTFYFWRFYTNSTNYYELTNPNFNFSTDIWLLNSALKTEFTAVGSPDWNNITSVEFRQTGNSPFHKWRIDGFGAYVGVTISTEALYNTTSGKYVEIEPLWGSGVNDSNSKIVEFELREIAAFNQTGEKIVTIGFMSVNNPITAGNLSEETQQELIEEGVLPSIPEPPPLISPITGSFMLGDIEVQNKVATQWLIFVLLMVSSAIILRKFLL